METTELKRLAKIEKRINEIVCEEMGLKCLPIEFDIIPPQKMLEIMAYNIPTNISNWKKGRDYERQRTIYEHGASGLPYEVVINSNPARAYLMSNNKFAVQCLVMAHVYGHTAFFSNNAYFVKSRQDIINLMYEASRRFLEYERRYGIDEVEKTVDAGHALQFHSSPFASDETEDDRRKRIFEQMKKDIHVKGGSYADISGNTKPEINEDIELFNQKLWRDLKLKTPVEPTADLLRYIIDRSSALEDWQRDILEVLRIEGQYYWPIMKTKFMNEGFATMVHQKVIDQLVKEKLMTLPEHADYNYANSLVKADPIFSLNPYTIGCGIWKDLEDRWNKGRHGREWEDCNNALEKDRWDTKDQKGLGKCIDVMKTYVDWFFIQEFLTLDLIKDLGIYLYMFKDTGNAIDAIITKETAREIKSQLVFAFAQSAVPTIEITNGNYNNAGGLFLKHHWDGLDLDEAYAKETMKHIAYLWGNRIILDTQQGEKTKLTWSLNAEEWTVDKDKDDNDDKSAYTVAWERYLAPYRNKSPLEIPYALPI